MKNNSLMNANVVEFILDLERQLHSFAELTHRCLNTIAETEITSPIEMMYLAALDYLITKENLHYTGPVTFEIKDQVIEYRNGIKIQPQASIGAFRVDFLITYFQGVVSMPGRVLSGNTEQLIIELDSKKFHDRDEQDRTHEKQRGRELVKKGLRLVRFTGSEVYADPLIRAREALHLLLHKETEQEQPLTLAL